MSVIFHILITAAYMTLAAVAAVALPQTVAAIDQTLALFLGGAVFLVCALAHQSLSQLSRGQQIARELGAVLSSNDAMLDELEETRSEILGLKASVVRESRAAADDETEDTERTSKEMLSEIKLLRTLLSQLPAGKTKPRHTEQSATAPVEAGADAARDMTLAATSQDRLELPIGQPREPVPPPTDYRADLSASESDDYGAPESDDFGAPAGAAYGAAAFGDFGRSPVFLPGLNDTGAPLPRTPASAALGEPIAAAPDPDDYKMLELTRDALERARVSLFLQPIVRLPTRRVTYYETFSRIRDPDDNLIGPEHYLEIAKRAGLIAAIDNNLLFRCVQLMRRVRRHKKDYGFFCNISTNTLHDATFFPQFIDFLAENREFANDLVFEFAQRDIADRYDESAEYLNRMAALGFRFSLDRIESLDLDYDELSQRRFRFVKINAETLVELVSTERGVWQLEEMQDELYGHRISLIIEKIETERQLVELLDQNVEYGQGYLFGEPRESRGQN